MKRIVRLLILLLFSTATAWANPISEQQARNNAINFLLTKTSMARGAGAIQPVLALKHNQGRYFIFNIGHEDGYVVMSGDDSTPAVLGYADEGSFNPKQMPPQMEAWLQSYADQIEYLQKHVTQSEQAPLKAADHAAIAPLLTTKWNQDEPYNNMCPIDPTTNQRSQTGCAAIAMAQILNYYKTPDKNLIPIPAYTTKSRNIQMPEIAPTTIDWVAMDENYKVGTHTDASENAVAQLALLCGQAIQMDYTSISSGADLYTLPNAFINYFGYSKNIRVANRNHYFKQTWENIIYTELANKRPVYYSGSSAGGGHGFIVDGYGHDGYFHINWGWGGFSDGYFLLELPNPYSNAGIGASTTEDGYTFNQLALLGTEPASTGTAPVSAPLTVHKISFEGGETLARTSRGFSINLHTSIFNVTEYEHNYKIGAGVFDNEGNLLEAKYIDKQYVLGKNEGYNDFSYNQFEFGKNLPDGTYRIKFLCSDEIDTEPQPCLNSNVYYIQAVVKGNMLTMQSPKVDLKGTIVRNDIAETGTPIFMTATIQNQGTDFCDDIYIYADDYIVGGRHFEALAGETIQLDFDCMVNTAGNHTISLYAQTSDGLISIATLPVYVEQGVTARHLDYVINITNMEEGVVHDEYAEINVSVNNNDSHIYSNWIGAVLFKQVSNQWKTFITDLDCKITLRPNNDTELNYKLGPLDANANYILSVYYISDNNWKDNGNEYLVQFKTAKELTPTGVSSPKAMQQSMSIYTLDGRRVHTSSVKQLPHGIYIVGGKKKVF